jgi:hypothetical protein
MLDQYGLSKVASHFNRFWIDIFQNWGKLRERSSESDDISSNILTQSIWFNKKLQQERWKKELNTEIVNWDMIYKIPFYCTKNNQFSVFQYKILHRILSTNSLLFKCKLKETQHCNLCNETKETILHLFWECNIVKSMSDPSIICCAEIGISTCLIQVLYVVLK